MKNVKLKDIADRLGVSATTVSMVLNGRSISVSEKTRQEITRTADEMGYIKRLAPKPIALFVPDFNNMYYSEFTKWLSLYAQDMGYNLIVYDSNNNSQREINNLSALTSRNVCGIIMAMTSPGAEIRMLINQKSGPGKIPVVLIDISNPTFNCHKISTDNYLGEYMAVEYLLSLGHKRIGHICGPISSSNVDNGCLDRLNGYKNAFADNGMSFEDSWIVEGVFNMESGYRLTKQLLDQKVTAIATQNDMQAFGVYHYLKEHGIDIPDDVSLIGFDDVSFTSVLETPLTTVSQKVPVLAKKAIDLITDEVSHYAISGKVMFKGEPELVIRQSVKDIRKR